MTAFPIRVVIDDNCDGCGKTSSGGITFGPGKPVLCESCTWAGIAALDRALGSLGRDGPAREMARLARYLAPGGMRDRRGFIGVYIDLDEDNGVPMVVGSQPVEVAASLLHYAADCLLSKTKPRS